MRLQTHSSKWSSSMIECKFILIYVEKLEQCIQVRQVITLVIYLFVIIF